MNRSDSLLFLTYTDDEVFLIDIRPHNEEYVFAQKELLNTIEYNFPEVLENFRIKDAIDVAIDIEDAQTIKSLREAGYNIIYKVNGKIYAPMGGGLTAAKTHTKSVRVRLISNDLIRMTRDFRKYIEENKTTIEKMIKDANTSQNEFNYKLILTDSGYRIMEVNSGILL